MENELSFSELLEIFQKEAERAYALYNIRSKQAEEAYREYNKALENMQLSKWAMELERGKMN